MFLQILNLLRADGSIVVNKTLARNIGLHEAIIYSELASKLKYYFERDMLTEDGYFFSTTEDLEESTTLTKRQQAKPIENLIRLGLIKKEIRKIGEAPKRFFTLNPDINILLPLLSDKSDKRLEDLMNTGKVQNVTIENDKKELSKVTKSHPNNTKDNNININNTKNKKMIDDDQENLEQKNHVFQSLEDIVNENENLIEKDHEIMLQALRELIYNKINSVNDELDNLSKILQYPDTYLVEPYNRYLKALKNNWIKNDPYKYLATVIAKTVGLNIK